MSTTPCRREEQEPVTEASAYPFAKHVITRTHTTPSNTVRTPVPEPKHPSRAIMTRVDAQLANELDPDEKIARLFSRKSPDCIPPGSVVMVETYLTPARTTSTAFSGVLIAVRRAGVATTFVLRTIAHKLGVEMRFHAYSPMIKDIKVIQRADAKKGSPGLTRTRRAKLYYMRRREDRRVNAVAGLVKQYRAAEQQKAPSATKPASSKASKKKK
ncbi:mitochondrial large ribosomal subunit protein [Malassezia pachydermatis]